MENIINNPGHQHIAENIFCNLSYKKLKICQQINQSCKEILENPLFWKEKFMQNLSKVNQNDWNAAVQITKNTDLEKNILLYMKMASKYVVDIPCYITSETLLKCSTKVQEYLGSTPFSFHGSFLEMGQLNFEKPCRFVLELFYPEDPDLGCIQALGSVLENFNIPITIMANAISNESEHLRMIKPLLPLMNETYLATNQIGRTPIHWAALRGHVEVVKLLACLTDCPNAPDKNGETPIFMAAAMGHTEVVKILAPLTGNPNVPNRIGQTPIHAAAWKGHTEIVKMLAPLTDSPNAPDENGNTPIYDAAWNGHAEIVKFLAPLTDNSNSPCKDGKTPNLCGSRKYIPITTNERKADRNYQNLGPFDTQS